MPCLSLTMGSFMEDEKMDKNESLNVIMSGNELEHLFAALLADLETIKGLIPAAMRAAETTIGAMTDLYQYQSLINKEKTEKGERPIQHFAHLGDLYDMVKLARRFADITEIYGEILARLDNAEAISLDASRISEIRKFLNQIDVLYIS